MAHTYDIAVIGSGFGGSLMAMVAKRIGLSVVLIERGKHPRFAIGESTSPLTNLILEQIADRYDLPRLVPLTTFGSWQRAYPEVVCGLKRGFTFFAHRAGERYRTLPDRSNQLLVAASPNDEVSDVHWLRSDVDWFFQREAVDVGVDYVDEVELSTPVWTDQGVVIDGVRQGERLQFGVSLVIDATGPRGFLSRVLSIPDDPFPNYPATQTLFSHFVDVRRCGSMAEFGDVDGAVPPYPLDDAALHHTFDGGWMWVLRLGNGVTSAGFTATGELAAQLRLSEGEPAWRQFLERFPSIGDQFAEARNIRPFTYWPRLSYRAAYPSPPAPLPSRERGAERGVTAPWVMLPSAAAFIDPLFSTGFPLTLLGIERLGRILSDAWDTDDWNERIAEYGRITQFEAEATAALVSGSYGGMTNFPAFASLSMFYFAAASYSEMARRVRPELVNRYLISNHPAFGAALRRSSDRARIAHAWTVADLTAFDGEVTSAVDELNVAGLCDPSKRNWYDADLADVIASAGKLGYSPSEMRRIIEDAPWARGCLIDRP